MRTDRKRLVEAFHRPEPPARHSRWLPYIALVATATFLAVVAFAVISLFGGAR